MLALGDSDEGGSFCISRRRVDEAGPNSLPELQDVVRGAVMRGHGDQWTVEEFMALYPEKNVNKKMYQRISTPEGFLRIIPFTGCFGNYEFYNGVEFDVNYKFPNNRLDDYTRIVSARNSASVSDITLELKWPTRS